MYIYVYTYGCRACAGVFIYSTVFVFVPTSMRMLVCVYANVYI